MTQQLKRNENLHPHKTGTQTSLAAVGPNWRQPKCPWTGELRDGMWCIRTVEHSSATRRNEVLLHATTWMKLKNIMLL